ncbi:MAG TPA: serine/threonine-protein kinase [Polyangiaceae bacterium]
MADAATTPEETFPPTIANFRVLCPLGSGGMARVYLCQTRGLGGFEKLLVLKVPREGLMAEKDIREMFLHEARVAGRLNHPNIVQTNEVGMANGLPFIAMEYLEGETLASLRRQVGLSQLDTHLQLRILSQALAGAEHAHESRKPDGTAYALVHRDISPQNVFITYDGAVKILDFGIAKIAVPGQEQTETGVFKGKIAYMAPEQVMGGNVDRRADVFAFGVMLWEAVAHKRFVPSGLTEFEVLRDRVGGYEPKIETVAPDTDPELVAICTKAIAKDPDERYQTALELKTAIDRYLARTPAGETEDLATFVRDAFTERRIAFRARVDAALRRSEEEFSSSDISRISEETKSGVLPAALAGGNVTGSSPAVAPSRARTIGILAGIAAAGAVAVFFVHRSHEIPSGAAAAPSNDTSVVVVTAAPEASSAAPPANAPSVHVEIHANPSNADISVDGTPAPGSSFVRDLAPSATPHHVKITAPGFTTLERDLVLDRSTYVDLKLDKATTPKGVVRKPTGGATPSKPTGPEIDESDPYRK